MGVEFHLDIIELKHNVQIGIAHREYPTGFHQSLREEAPYVCCTTNEVQKEDTR